MNQLIQRINQRMTLRSATVIISASLALGMFLGLVKTQLINSNFHPALTDAYFSAFKLPELILYTLGAGALSVAFIPVLSDKLYKSNRQQAWRLTSYVLNIICLIMFVVCLILVLFPKFILQEFLVSGDGFDEERLIVASQIMRLAATGPLIFAVSSIFSSVQHVVGRFLFSAIAPIFYHLSIIASIYLFKDSMGIVCLGLGAAIGAILNLIILGFGMNNLSFKHIWQINFKDKFLKQIFKVLPFRSLDQGVIYMNSIVQLRLASSFADGTIANLENSLMLYNAPITLLGVALGTAAFPKFAQRLSQKRPDLFEKEFVEVLRAAIWIAIPATIICFIYREPLAHLLFTRKNDDIAMILGWLTIGILFRTMYAIVSRFYYAQKDTLTPMLVAIIAFISNWLLSYWLSQKYGVVGFGMATSLVTVIEIFILLLAMRTKKIKPLSFKFLLRILPVIFVGLMTLSLVLLSSLITVFNDADNLFILTLKLGVMSSLTISIYFFLSYIFKIKETYLLLKYLKNLFKKFANALHERRI